jgi:tellurite methyltransferase
LRRLNIQPYDQKYESNEYYWGEKPTPLCDQVISLINEYFKNQPLLLDLGCGEGRDAVHFARNGFKVIGLDTSVNGLKKTRKLAEKFGVYIKTICTDMLDFHLNDQIDVIYSSGSIQYIHPNMRSKFFSFYKNHTSKNGIHAHTVLLEKPFIPRAPDAEENEKFLRSGEIMSYYWDWKIHYINEEIIDCNSGNIPHKHVLNQIIAQKIS